MREFVSTLLTCSATMSALGLLYMALTPLLARRYCARSRYRAWLIIIVGLMIPFRPRLGSAFVAYHLPAEASPPVPAQSNVFAMVTPSLIPELSAQGSSFSFWEIATAVWLAGMIAFIGYHAIQHYRFTKMTMRWSEEVTLAQALSILDSARAEIGVTREIGLYQCPTIGSPSLLGWLHPRILLPQAALPEEELAFILRHELIHYKRGDLWYKGAVLLAAAIHWFNPLIYLLVKAIDSACELSCDAETVRHADMDARQRYSETIIGVVRHQSKLKTALSTNFYGGKRDMKKRIDSILDTRSKKTGIILLCGMLILTLATGIAFAASTTESKAPSLNPFDPIPDMQAVSVADQATMTRFDPETGKTFYSWDLGKTWAQLTNEEYDRLFSPSATHWWTYEEYEAWMDEQIKGLQALVDDGASGYYDKDGVLHSFEQADVDETTALYQATLENIKNGYRVSKPLNGSALSQDVLPGAVETYAIASDNDYSEYSQFGLTYDAKTNQLYYHGELVRRFYDERTSSVVTRTFNPNGSVDITAKRNAGNELIGLYKHSQQEFDERSKAMGEAASLSVSEQRAVTAAQTVESPAYDYSKYAPYALSYDKATRKLYYKGEPVRYFEDSYPLGEDMAAYWDYFDQDGTIDVHAVRDLSKIVYNPDGSHDPSGILIGVEPYSQAAFNARDIAQYASVNSIPQIASTASYSASATAVYESAAGFPEKEGDTFEQIFEKYKEYGITFDPNSAVGGLGNIHYYGKLVKTFVDINPDGGVISFSSSDGGEITIRTVYNQNGQVTGLEVSQE